MSVQTVNQFLQTVREASQLQEELNKALERENSPQALTDFAAKHGYQFTAEEFSAEAQHLQNEFQQRQDAEELNEEELKSVVGGNPPAVIVLTAAAFIILQQKVNKASLNGAQNIKTAAGKRT
jgi:predicted ribosomally synthesized peptide with nif11-like leader